MIRSLILAAALGAVTAANAEDLSVTGNYPTGGAVYPAITSVGNSVLARDGGAVGIAVQPAPGTTLHAASSSPALRLEEIGQGQGYQMRPYSNAGLKTFGLTDLDTGIDRIMVDDAGSISFSKPGPLSYHLEFDGTLKLMGPGNSLSEIWVPYPNDQLQEWRIGRFGSNFMVQGLGPANLSDPGMAISPDGRFFFGPQVSQWDPAAAAARGNRLETGFPLGSPPGLGAVLTDAGVWQSASSRKYKEDIRPLEQNSAQATLDVLEPVEFRYKSSPGQLRVGFIAEDVPDLIAAGDRKGLSPMTVAAVLARVVQEQQKMIQELQQRIDRAEKKRHEH